MYQSNFSYPMKISVSFIKSSPIFLNVLIQYSNPEYVSVSITTSNPKAKNKTTGTLILPEFYVSSLVPSLRRRISVSKIKF